MDSLHAHINVYVCTYACEYERLIHFWMGNLQLRALFFPHVLSIENNSSEFGRLRFTAKVVSQLKESKGTDMLDCCMLAI